MAQFTDWESAKAARKNQFHGRQLPLLSTAPLRFRVLATQARAHSRRSSRPSWSARRTRRSCRKLQIIRREIEESASRVPVLNKNRHGNKRIREIARDPAPGVAGPLVLRQIPIGTANDRGFVISRWNGRLVYREHKPSEVGPRRRQSRSREGKPASRCGKHSPTTTTR